jgi:hypothetical protein
MKPTSYWERRRSFWSTPKGAAIYVAAIIVLLIGGLVALNLYSSPFPVIEYFRSSPMTISPGESSNLSWAVIGAENVEISPGIGMVELKGSRRVSPSTDTIYTLIALNGTRNRSSETIVRLR